MSAIRFSVAPKGNDRMYARVVSGSIPPEHLDEAIQLWRTTVAPSVQQRKGFRSARLLVDRSAVPPLWCWGSLYNP